MLESILTEKNVSLPVRITVKSAVSVGLIALAVLLPQLVHIAAGAQGGMRWLPMYLPVLLAGCLMGPVWGIGTGLLSPLVSFALTSAAGEAMPAAARLPFMMAELAVFAAVSGAFSKKISQNGWMAFPAVLLAQVSGRLMFLLLVVLFSQAATIAPEQAWSQIQAGFVGMIAQAVVVPFAVMGLKKLLETERKHD